ncbi:MAG TPA: hypothetical protein DD381_01210 [Lentisphaeria bacterium]|nr:MAG: hypothetical protein A2X47_13450 [Lentisphaerae bacterium GWF2_38_69]HBM14962.1 hypothetical protein [Lentisphaeria bacterium]
MKPCLKYLCLTFPIAAILVLLSILFFDRGVAYAVQTFYNPSEIKENARLGIYLTYCSYCAMLPVMAGYYFFRLEGYEKTKFMRFIRQLSLSFVFAYFIKDILQFFFGRTTVLDYATGKLNFHIHPGRYGFHFFSLGADSFPSGHMTLICAAMLSVILFYPKLKIPSILLVMLMLIALLLNNFHFLGDTIAGAYLGTSIALGVYYIGVYKNETQKTDK